MYRHAPEDYVCPFCLLAQGIQNEYVYSAPSDIVYQNASVTAFVSSRQWPRNVGNVLVIPNRHFENLFELPVDLAGELHKAIRAVAFALKAALSCDGVSTRQHNEPAGNQDVWHYHQHVTPRYQGDEFYTSQHEFMPAERRAQVAAMIKAQLCIEL